MSNTNRDYAIVYDIKNSSLTLSRPLVFYITDKNTSNIFVRLVTKTSIGGGVDQYTDIEDASSYILLMRVIKPNDEITNIKATQREQESIFEFDLTENFKDIPGTYICELMISTIVDSRQELITSDSFTYEVKRSVLSKIDQIIEHEETTVEKLLNELDATEARLFNDLELAKTNLHNDLESTKSELNSQVQANDNKIENIKGELSSQVKDNKSELEHIRTNIYGKKNIKEYEHLVTDNDWIRAFEQASIECGANGYDLYIPSGTYPISRTWYIPNDIKIYGAGGKSRIIANAQMCADSLNSSCAVISLDNGEQPIYKFSHMYIGAETSNNNLNGLHIGSCRCSEFSHLVIQNLGGSGVLIYPTREDSSDLENFSITHVWTNKVNEGLTMKTNKNIGRGNITDGQIMYCQFTTLDDAYTKNSGYAINVQGEVGKYMFGVTFTRCFVHTRVNSLINVENEEGSITYDLHFNHIKGELWGRDKLGDDVSSVYCTKIKNLRNSSFTYNFLNENNSKGVYLSNCQYNDFQNFYWNHLVNPTAKYFYLDKDCMFNSLNFNIDGAYYESNNVYANYPFDLFKEKIIDLGYSNFVYNSPIKNQVKLINEPSKIFDVSNSLLTNYNEFSIGYKAELIDGALRITLKANVQDARILIPINLKGLKHVGFYLKYKIESDNFVDDLETGISGIAKPLKKDNKEHELCVVFDNRIMEYNYYYIRCLNGQSLNNNVVITIYDWEIYEGFTIPYLPNYICMK